MKTKILKLSIIILLIYLIGAGCKKDEPLETDPAKIILGKWELVELGGEPVKSPLTYSEYLPDSILRVYDYKTGEFSYKKYWIDTLLHKGVYRSDRFFLTFSYEYKFTEYNNNMDLTSTAIMMHRNSVYKRIK